MKHAFSLVELSIVLVILGLLTGGILAGQSLIRASELRALTTQQQAFQVAVNTFRDQYFQLPGDITNATAFWGVAHATQSTCSTTVSTGTETCNGNGNGAIQAATNYDEIGRMWQHLANAGLIPGSYDGVADFASDYVPGQNVPRTPISGSMWLLDHFDAMHFAIAASAAGNALLTPEETWSIDTKLDDGNPVMGRVLADGATCLAAPGFDSYDFSVTDKGCDIYFFLVGGVNLPGP